jgi:hypothetical protein
LTRLRVGHGVAAIVAVAAFACLVAGCGSSGHAPHTTTTSTNAVTRTTGSARPVAVHHVAKGSHYGKLPSWLPSAKPPRQTLQHASLSHPVLTIQGDGLAISVHGAELHVIAVGPAVPEIGKTPVPPTSPVTFVVTFSHVTAPVALRPLSFVLIDEDHHVHLPRVTAMDGGPAPTALRPGPPVSIKLHSVLPTGDGGLEWRPDGQRVIAAWDFNVEID